MICLMTFSSWFLISVTLDPGSTEIDKQCSPACRPGDKGLSFSCSSRLYLKGVPLTGCFAHPDVSLYLVPPMYVTSFPV